MRRLFSIATGLLLLGSCTQPLIQSKLAVVFPSYNPAYPVPDTDTATAFRLSQDYPDTFNAKAVYPWQAIDFHNDYQGYLKAVLGYCLEGNTEVDFRVQDNKVRTWYHAPWLHFGTNGREYHHGLTRERRTPVGEMMPMQDVPLENWAVGFYNAPGGYTFGKVWHNGPEPVLQTSVFPEGTVCFKLLFTAGTEKQVPFLKGTKSWTANIFRGNPDDKNDTLSRKYRYDSVVHLLQIDVAIKDRRAGGTGWVLGTFIYDGSRPGATPFDRMVPVGVSWGNDPAVDTLRNRFGPFVNTALQESIVNTDLIPAGGPGDGSHAYMTHFGRGGRTNGPVDNPRSSCMSCHGSSAVTASGRAQNMGVFTDTISMADFRHYYQNVPAGADSFSVQGKTYYRLDYSLQMEVGVRNFYQATAPHAASARIRATAKEVEALPEVTRDGLKQ